MRYLSLASILVMCTTSSFARDFLFRLGRCSWLGFRSSLTLLVLFAWNTASADLTNEEWHCNGDGGQFSVHAQSHAECVSLARQHFNDKSENIFVGEKSGDIWIDSGISQRRNFNFKLHRTSDGVWFTSTSAILADKLHPIREDKVGQDSCDVAGNPIVISQGMKVEKVALTLNTIPFEFLYRSQVGTYRDVSWTHTYTGSLVEPSSNAGFSNSC